jgi:PAS domain-containing protein
MIDLKDPEHITLVFTVLGGLGTFLSLIWVKAIKPVIKLLQSQEDLIHSLQAIKKELTTNGGNSLKDAVIDLRTTIGRMETRQKVIEQRTKAALHYTKEALFETDDHGRLVWTNYSFYELTSDLINSVDGYDWLSYIHEEEREEFFNEFRSCLDMNRKFVKITRNCEDKTIKLIGFPYKINDSSHGGFLVSISISDTKGDLT